MPRNKPSKKIPEFEFSFNDISFCNDNKLKPFVETFIQEPENISQQSLGTIFGIFEIDENSEDSSYITNYLISVIKKEYFSKPKRGVIESFEAALHKANLALSKLAEHGNVAWIGKINVACAVLEKYNLHLTQIGTCHTFLLREKNLTDIGENLSSPEDNLNPLKTFTDVSSGKIEENDKIIIATNNILDIFSLEEIKKSANKFPEADFVRFLHTALINELEKAAVLVVDIKRKEEKEPEVAPASYQEDFNAFSSMSFTKTIPNKEPLAENLKEEIKVELEKSNKEIEDARYGHIYIKEIENLPENKTPLFSFSLSGLGNSIIKGFEFSKEKTKNIFSNLFFRVKSVDLRPIFFKIKISFQKSAAFLADIVKQLFQQIKNFSKRIRRADTESAPLKTAVTEEIGAQLRSEVKLRFVKFLPDFSKIKDLFARFSYEQKIYALIILLLIFIVPYVGVKIERIIAEKKAAQIAQDTPREIIPLEQDKNVIRLSDLNTPNQSAGTVSKIVNLNNKIFFIGNLGIFDLEKNQLFSFSSQIGAIKTSAGMNDLNLILLITEDQKAFSFSPTSEKFQPNLIEIPTDSNISASETYLTYLYLADNKANQIYRYPRAEGGFGTKINWLKDTTDLSKISDISVNENIFAASLNEMLKLFKGQRQDFSLEETATPIICDKIYVSKSNLEMYVLDKTNSRIVHLSPEGTILNQYYNEKIKEASAFSVDEEKNIIYFAKEKEIYSFNISRP